MSQLSATITTFNSESNFAVLQQKGVLKSKNPQALVNPHPKPVGFWNLYSITG